MIAALDAHSTAKRRQVAARAAPILCSAKTARSTRPTNASSGARSDAANKTAIFWSSFISGLQSLDERGPRPCQDGFQGAERDSHDPCRLAMRAAFTEAEETRGALALAEAGQRALEVDGRIPVVMAPRLRRGLFARFAPTFGSLRGKEQGPGDPHQPRPVASFPTKGGRAPPGLEEYLLRQVVGAPPATIGAPGEAGEKPPHRRFMRADERGEGGGIACRRPPGQTELVVHRAVSCLQGSVLPFSPSCEVLAQQ